jgi:hypothetical protein
MHHDLWHWMDLHVGPAGLGACGGPSVLSGTFLAGQDYDATTSSLSFSPSCVGLREAGWPTVNTSLPVWVPGALGTLHLPAAASAGDESSGTTVLVRQHHRDQRQLLALPRRRCWCAC